MKKTVFICVLLFFIQSVKSQEKGFGIEGSYTFKFVNKTVNQLYLGGIHSFSKGNRGYNSYDDQFLIGGGAYYGRYNGKEKWIPALTLGYGAGAGLLYRASITPYNIVPSFNLNMFNVIQVGLGYSFGYKHINGVNMNGVCLTINLSLDFSGHWINIST